jgi:hypothetical protein
MGSSKDFYDRGTIMSDILNAIFNNRPIPPVDNIYFVLVDTTDGNKVIDKVSAKQEFYDNLKRIEEGGILIVKLDKPSDADIGFVYTPDEGE